MLGEEAFKGSEIILPTMLIKEPTRLDLGGRELLLEPQATAHTDNDLIVTDTKTDTLFLGDLLFSVHVPTLDGSIKGWLALLDELGNRKAARVVPGTALKDHGTARSARTRAALPGHDRGRRPPAKSPRARPWPKRPKPPDSPKRNAWKLFDQYHVRNVTAAFAELEWE